MSRSRILAFAGSARLESFNKKLGRAAAAGAEEAGAATTLVDLRDFPLPLYDADLEQAEGLGVLEDLAADSVRLDFTAGFHVQSPAPEAARVAPEGGTGGSRRTVPSKFLDWSASCSGYLSDFGVLDLVRILDVSQKSGVLVLRFPDAEGAIRLSEGEILSAELHPTGGDAARDEEAIYRMIERKEGTFRFEQCAVDRNKTVKLSNTMVLMEACRRIDEKSRG